MRPAMRRIGLLGVGLVLFATTGLAAEKKKGSGTLALVAKPARFARLAEIAKDASPPKPGGPKRGAEKVRVISIDGRSSATR